MRWTLEGLYRSPALFNAYGESLRETTAKTDTENLFLLEMQEEADGRAFWAGALANPLPALGVCREVRPVLLQVRGE